MSGMLPIVVLGIILLLAGYVVYRSIVEERRRPLGEDPVADHDLPDHDLPSPGLSSADLPRPDLPRPDLPRPDLPRSDLPRPDRPRPHLPEPDRPEAASPPGEQHDAGPAVRGRSRPRRRRSDRPDPDPALAEHVGKLREAVDAHLISTDEAVASLVRSSGGSLDDDSARAILADSTHPSPRGSAS